MDAGTQLGPFAQSALDKAFKEEVKAAFAAFCLNLSTGQSLSEAEIEFRTRITNTKAAYNCAAVVIKEEFTP